MNELNRIGISLKTIEKMLEINEEIKDMSNDEITDKERILMAIGCDEKQIISIMGSNPQFLSRTNDDLVNLIKYLLDKGFTELDILIEANPYILNLAPFEIEEYINSRICSGDFIYDIIDELDSNPYLFSEI